jgi:ATP/maltotriose-dependent transcriptional regulator MalT
MHLEEAVTIGRSLGDTPALRATLLFLGLHHHSAGDLSRARSYFEQCRVASTAVGDRWITAIALAGMGDLALTRGEIAEARHLFEEALILEQALHNKLGAGSALGSLGNLARVQDDVATARSYYRHALVALRDAGAPAWIVRVLCGVAFLLLTEGQPARALRLTSAAHAPHSAWLATVERDAAAKEGEEWQRIRTTAQRRIAPRDADAAWAEGQAMTLEQAVADALEGLGHG